MLSKRCKHEHVHQPLVGGRCADAAFYPLGLIRAILKGIRNTAMAAGARTIDPKDDKMQVRALKFANSLTGNDANAIAAVMNSKGPYVSSVVAPPSSVKKAGGGTLPVGYTSENFKANYLDEYTGEILPEALIRAAVVEELN